MRTHNREFFRSLAKANNVEYIDFTDIMLQYPFEAVTLQPENGHFSRYGNQILAAELSKFIQRNDRHRIKVKFDQIPLRLGDLGTGLDEVWNVDPRMPYRVVTNEQGLRMNAELSSPKSKQRVLCLGDSFTFGPYLPNHDTYPGLLQKIFPEKEIMNAGVSGYSINQEQELFAEKAKFTEPDLVTLQVLDNDISDLLSAHKNTYSRHGTVTQPNEAELRFYEFIESRKGKK